MKSDNVLFLLAIIAAIISLLSAGFVYVYTDNFKRSWVTGFASDTAYVNITVASTGIINFTWDTVNWSSGSVTGGTNATLSTVGGGVVVNGNWSTSSQTGGLLLENIGNINLSLTLQSGKTAATFLGGTGPRYLFNLTSNESSSCLNSSGGIHSGLSLGDYTGTNGTWSIFNTSAQLVCPRFDNNPARNSIRIDILLDVPSNSFIGSLSDIITATGT